MNSLQHFGFFLERNRLWTRRFEQRVSVLRLTLPQCKVLVYLNNHEGISQVQLAELTDIEPMSLVRILDRLESRGWLERRCNVTDRRVRCIFLTADGKPLVDTIWRLIDVTHREAFAGIPRKHADLMIELLEKIRSNLASPQPRPGNRGLKRTRSGK